MTRRAGCKPAVNRQPGFRRGGLVEQDFTAFIGFKNQTFSSLLNLSNLHCPNNRTTNAITNRSIKRSNYPIDSVFQPSIYSLTDRPTTTPTDRHFVQPWIYSLTGRPVHPSACPPVRSSLRPSVRPSVRSSLHAFPSLEKLQTMGVAS